MKVVVVDVVWISVICIASIIIAITLISSLREKFLISSIVKYMRDFLLKINVRKKKQLKDNFKREG